MDSSQAAAASSGALNNFKSYLHGKLANLVSALQASAQYISAAVGLPPGLVYSSLAALVAVPVTMSRYGWSLGREQTSPYGSLSSGIPAVTDDDFSYITSQDLDGSPYTARSQAPPPGAAAAPDDDVLLIKNKSVTYPAHFPAYSIDDGKLRVRDVRERIGLMMELTERATRRVKLLYKGRQLKEPTAPVRDYGVKNKSELMAVVSDAADDESASDEEMVIVGDAAADDKSRRRKKKKGSKKRSGAGGRGDGDSASSPRDDATSPRPPLPPAASAALKRIEELSSEFTSKWLPLCVQYTAAPPPDPKAREEEHRKLSETLLQNILLKLDGVETDGVAEVRTRRKELVHHVQEVLKGLDAAAKA